jgi:hypothetical protein
VRRYQVNVVASYVQAVDLAGIFARLPKNAAGFPDIDTPAEDWTLGESVLVTPPLNTLTVSYPDVEGRDPDEARQFALAIFARDVATLSLPAAETVVANLDESLDVPLP